MYVVFLGYIMDDQRSGLETQANWPNKKDGDMFIFGYSFMLRSRNQTANQIPRSYKNDRFDWPFGLVIVTWKNNPIFSWTVASLIA